LKVSEIPNTVKKINMKVNQSP